MTFVFWLAVVMLVDAAIGLWGLNLWQQMAPKLNIKKLAFYETLVALVMLIVYFVRR